MKNWEKFESEIRGLKTTSFGLLKSGPLRLCIHINCNNCEFHSGECSLKRVDWLYSDYEESKPKLTERERAIVEAFNVMGTNYRIARDADDKLYICAGTPIRADYDGYSTWSVLLLDPNLFPFITRESGKVWSIGELMELKVKE